MRDIRLIVTDLDGTFLNGYRSFHPGGPGGGDHGLRLHRPVL